MNHSEKARMQKTTENKKIPHQHMKWDNSLKRDSMTGFPNPHQTIFAASYQFLACDMQMEIFTIWR